VIAFIICAVLVVFIADALYARARIKLRTRAAASHQPSHSLASGTGSGGWRSLNEDARERGEAAQVEDYPFAGLERIVSNNARRESSRRGASLG
jgi:hypothetical protein